MHWLSSIFNMAAKFGNSVTMMNMIDINRDEIFQKTSLVHHFDHKGMKKFCRS